MYPLCHLSAQKWVLNEDWEFILGFETPSILRYLEPLTSDIFTARFADCQFNEVIFPILEKKEKERKRDISWNEPSLLHLDPYTK